ncbi:OmpA family protein [Hydrogenophaga sp.]|uniref:OmpA/MotB family protein n=1 Tax=Hydrogenophaga sp. TaxID=1904254 RepID=UPI0025C570E3|nr:OmpA family protein [Hydrogenophaga sp.]
MSATLSAAGTPPPATPVAPAVAQPRAKAAGRRFRRWHLDTPAPTEEEGWLLTYLDVITLMLVMMVVMLSLAGPPDNAPTPAPTAQAASTAAATAAPSAASDEPAVIPLPVLTPETSSRQESPAQGLPQQGLSQEVDVTEDANAVRFRLSSEFLFGPGGAELTQAGYPVLDELIPVLNADPTLRLVIEGHTDNTPIQSARFPSNWELSTSRAAAVARYLAEHGVAPQRLQASGFADTRPIGGKDNPVDRKANRRVDLVMEKAQAAPARR